MKIQNRFSDLYAEIDNQNNWVTLRVDDGSEAVITLGRYPNARFKVLEALLKKVKEKTNYKNSEKKVDKAIRKLRRIR